MAMTKREWEMERAEMERMEDAALAGGLYWRAEAIALRARLAALPYESEGELAATVVALRAELAEHNRVIDTLNAEAHKMASANADLHRRVADAERERDEADYAAELTVQQFGWLSKSHTKNFQDVAASQAQVAALREALEKIDRTGPFHCSDKEFVDAALAVAKAALATPHDDSALRAHDAGARAEDAPWAAFGAWVFEEFWHDGEPGDIEGMDAQEAAVRFGLLGRTSEVDAGATHAEECDCSPDTPHGECCCYSPMLPVRALPPQEVKP